MEAEIGEAAGAIGKYLDQHGQTTLAKLKERTRLAEQPLLMGLGWLAREAKVTLVKDKRSIRVSTRVQQ